MNGVAIPSALQFEGLSVQAVQQLATLPQLQTEADWHEQRLGRITGSRFNEVKINPIVEQRHPNGNRATKSDKLAWIAKHGMTHLLPEGKRTLKDIDPVYRIAPCTFTGGGIQKTSWSYLYELIGEVITKEPADQIASSDLDWGIDHEAEAIEAYEKSANSQVEKIGFVTMQEHSQIGCTPDGLVGKDGVIEVKCPAKTKHHIKTIIRKEVPAIYKDQINGHLLITNRKWCDFISYDPRCKGYELCILRVQRDEQTIQALKKRLLTFLKTYQQTLKELNLKL